MSSAEAYIEELEKLYQPRTAASSPLRILFDAGVGTLPISFTMQRGKELASTYPNVGKIRTAVLSNKIVEVRIVDLLMRLMRFPNTRIRFFELSHRDEALKWVLQNN